MRRKTSLASKYSRITVLTVLVVMTTIYWVQNSNGSKLSLRGGVASDRNIWVQNDAQKFNDHNIAHTADHLVMVAGHSVIVSGHLEDAGTDEKDWYLLDYQKGHGLPQAILAHIRQGIKIASQDQNSILIFSGGETRASTGPINEGSSYFRVADAMKLWNESQENLADGNSISENTVRARSIAEEFATDSFQNLLFSICRFKEVTGHYPKKITVVSFSFKQRRFEELHAIALRWPMDAFQYVGIDPDASTGFDLGSSAEGEKTNSAIPFESDPYGCHTQILQEKRQQRNPFSRTPPYELTCPEMKELLKWCGPDIISSVNVPW